MNYIVEPDKKWIELEEGTVARVRKDQLVVVCLGSHSGHPDDFKYVVYDKHNKLRAKFIMLDYAIEYAEFLV